METKKTKKNPYKVFKDLTIANTTIAWVEFLYVIALTVVAALIWSKVPVDQTISIQDKYIYIVYCGTVLLLANIGLAIAQSVYAKKIGKVAANIGYEQVICVLIMLVGFAYIIGDAGVYCGGVLRDAQEHAKKLFGAEFDPLTPTNSHWLVYITTVCFGVCALFTGAFASYNTALCAKVKVFKAKAK